MMASRNTRAASAALVAATVVLAGSLVPTHAAPAKLYTEQQAQKGETVYAQNCAACHGPKMQGASGPAIAGTAFLKRTTALGWTIENFRHVVVTTMPRSNPGSLSDQQYADVLAYLLATDCYPPGQSQFPTKETPKLKSTKLQEPQGVTPDNKKLATCQLHQHG